MTTGRKTKYKPDFHPTDYIAQSKRGKCKIQIACAWEVHVDTIYEWQKHHKAFSDAIKIGEQHLANWYIQIGQSSITGRAILNGKETDLKNFNLGSFVWMTKNILKWTDKVESKVEHSGELKSGLNREQSLKKMFKDEKSRALALELSEHLCEQEELLEKEKEEKNGKN